MGQPNSLPAREHRRSVRSLKLSSLYSRAQKRSMSATFYVLDHDMVNNLLNINTATEEQLMTLPLITRETAHNIIEYRQRIGKFKRIDDLALVSGIGADKLNAFRGEICVRECKLNSSGVSTSISSLDSVRTQEVGCVNRYVDLNSSGIFELQSVAGVTQEIAANIIHYREKKGRFKSVENLRKVKGIDNLRFSVLKAYFVVNLDSINEFNTNNNLKSNGFCKFSDVNTKINTNACRKDSTVVTVNNNHPPLNDIFDLLSAYSHRPAVEDFGYARNNRPTIRVATWNLHALTLEKAQNLGFLEVCCRTILENRFSILAIQEVQEEDALRAICDELNSPKLRRVIEFEEKHHKIKNVYQYVCSNKLGFIYNSINERIHIQTVPNTKSSLEEMDSQLASVQLRINNSLQILFLTLSTYNAAGIVADIGKKYLNSEIVIILGDFTGFLEDEDVMNEYAQHITALPLSTKTNSINSDKSIPFNDNICLSEGLRSIFTGYAGMVTEGLSHLAIPRGWTWGGVASEHCPVWCEIHIDELQY